VPKENGFHLKHHAKSATRHILKIEFRQFNENPGGGASCIKVAPSFGEESSSRDDPTLGHFDLVHTAKREEELHEVRRRILRDLADNGTHCVGNRGVEKNRADPHACKIHPHLLTCT
jgi:hypothetical protein